MCDCKDCRYWKADSLEQKEGWGKCHRRAPRPQFVTGPLQDILDSGCNTVWPSAHSTDSCGEGFPW